MFWWVVDEKEIPRCGLTPMKEGERVVVGGKVLEDEDCRREKSYVRDGVWWRKSKS